MEPKSLVHPRERPVAGGSASKMTTAAPLGQVDQDIAVLKLKVHFRKRLLQLIPLLRISPERSALNMRDIKQQWSNYVEYLGLMPSHLVAAQLEKALLGVFDFMIRYESYVDEYFQTRSFKGIGSQESLREILKAKLPIVEVEEDLRGFCTNVCKVMVDAIVSTTTAKMEANKATEELLADYVCQISFGSYLKQMDKHLTGSLYTDADIKYIHKTIAAAVLTSFILDQKPENFVKLWEKPIEMLRSRIEKDLQHVLNRNNRNLIQLRKMMMSSFHSGQRAFDCAFPQVSDFSSLANVETFQQSALTEALKHADGLPEVIAEEVKHKLTTYAFAKTVQLSSVDHENIGPAVPGNHPSLQSSETTTGSLMVVDTYARAPLMIGHNSMLSVVKRQGGEEVPGTSGSDASSIYASKPALGNIDGDILPPDCSGDALKIEKKFTGREETALGSVGLVKQGEIKLDEAEISLETEDQGVMSYLEKENAL